MLKNRLTKMTVVAATLVGALAAVAGPASAATCPAPAGYTSQLSSYRNWYGVRYLYRHLPGTAPQGPKVSKPVAAPGKPVAAPGKPVAAPAKPVAAPAKPVAAPAKPVAAPAKPVAAPAKPVAAPATPAPSASMTAEEQQMLTLVNAERAKNGLGALKADTTLTKMARAKSQDMISNNYFAHQSPTYGSPFEMMTKFGITYRSAGENIAGNPSVTGAFQAWMNSPGHRANILSSQYNLTGIGIVHGGPYGIMFTQEFVGR